MVHRKAKNQIPGWVSGSCFPVSERFRFHPHPCGMRLKPEGLSHGLTKCPPDTLLPRLWQGRPFESLPEYQKTRYPDGYLVFWYTGRDSNPQPSEPESDALSIEPPVRLLYSGSIISGFWDFVKGKSKKFSAFFRQRGAFSRLTAKETVVFPPILWYNQQKHITGEGTLRWNS